MRSALKNMLIELNHVDHCVVTYLENSPFKKLLLALDLVTPGVGTLMHDLMGVAFRGLKTVL